MNPFPSFDEFLQSYNIDPVDTLNKLVVNRKFSEKPINRNTYKRLQEKLKEGNTLEEFFELISLNKDENLVRLMNTWLPFKDLIEEAKGTFPLIEGLWKLSNSTYSLLNLKNKPLNDIEVSEKIFMIIFKYYLPLAKGEKYQITFNYDNNKYNAFINKTEKGLLLHWNQDFENKLKGMYSYFEIDNKGSNIKVDYELHCRFLWSNYLKGIEVFLDIREITIYIDKNSFEKYLIPEPVIEKFFHIKNVDYPEKFDLFIKKDKLKFKGSIKKIDNKYYLEWDKNFIHWINEQNKSDSKITIKYNGQSNIVEERYSLSFEVDTVESKSEYIINSDSKQEIDTSYIIDIDNKIVTNTEKNYIAKYRIGHTAFKNSLFRISRKCRLCNMADENFLIASHIKPWNESNNVERLDVNNGLLLCPNHDFLFDKGYISFDMYGKILISSSIEKNTSDLLNINDNMKIEIINDKQSNYIKWHRENRYKDNL